MYAGPSHQRAASRRALRKLAGVALLWRLAPLIGVSACGAFDDFEVTIEDSATIPGTWGTGTPLSPTYDGKFNGLNLAAESNFANQDVKPDDVDAIFVKSVELRDSEPQLNNLQAVIDSVELFVEAPGQPKQRIANGSGFPAGGSAMLTVDSTINLKPYATASNMVVSAQIQLKRRPAFTFRLTTVVTLNVDINLLGT
jgi:hypothetical protein